MQERALKENGEDLIDQSSYLAFCILLSRKSSDFRGIYTMSVSTIPTFLNR